MIRSRTDADVRSLCDLIRLVHRNDSYPTMLQDDVESFFRTQNCLAAWVCEKDGRIVGHVALHTIWSDEVAALASSSLQRPRTTLASVSRLFVDATVRREGIGAALLAIATSEARERDLMPVLDVVTTYAQAIALYERAGWNRIGTIALPMPNGQPIDEHVYAAPP
jgi:GNAT superfamily N-acetyltransferase